MIYLFIKWQNAKGIMNKKQGVVRVLYKNFFIKKCMTKKTKAHGKIQQSL